MFEYYNNLPDYLSVDELKKHFQKLLEAFEHQVVDIIDFNKSLKELSDRQWHTYTILEPDLRSRIDLSISEILMNTEWAQANQLICRKTLSIIGNLGLRESYMLLLTSTLKDLDDEKNQDIKRLVDQIEIFRGGQIEDPYSGINTDSRF